MVAPALIWLFAAPKIIAAKVGIIKLAGITYKVAHASLTAVGTVVKYGFVITAAAAAIDCVLYVTMASFELLAALLGRRATSADMEVFVMSMLERAAGAGIRIGRAGLAIYLSPAVVGGLTVLAIAGYCAAPYGGARRTNDRFQRPQGFGAGGFDDNDDHDEYPPGQPQFTLFHPIPTEGYSRAEIRRHVSEGICARQAADHGLDTQYTEAYIEVYDF